MTSSEARAGSDWLALREPADAVARSADLVDRVRGRLSRTDPLVVHDLGCGTGSMARWLSARLEGPQRWVLYDRDVELLPLASADPPRLALDGSPVSIETRRRDITRLDPEELTGADLVTASALLDMMTAPELERFVVSCSGPRCPVLVALSVTGDVELAPADPLDRQVGDAFNDHQRRGVGAGRLLGPDAVEAATYAFGRSGSDVVTRPSPWRLGPAEAALVAEWFTGWLGAACEQRPDLRAATGPYARRRLAQAGAGELSVVVGHQDLLALPRSPVSGGARRG